MDEYEYEVKCLPNGYFQHLETINNILFTAREIDIISCIAHMRGSSKIASLLDVATKTVETHINNIKNKIDNNVREGIIDFIEKSGKSAIIRKHYQNLLIKADFNKKLRSLSNTISNSSAVCYFFCNDPKNSKSIISNIQNHLKIAGIKLRTCAINEEIINYQPKDHFIYVVSAKPGNKTFIIKALQAYKRHPDLFTFLVAEDLNNELMLEFADIPYINFLQYENYYLQFIEVIKKLSPKINFGSITTHLKQYHNSITEQQGIIINDINNCTTTTNIAIKPTQIVSIYKNNKLIVPMVLLFLTFIILIGYNKMNSNVPNHIISYIPEILTGYERFIGRDKELQQIKQTLHTENIIIITGCAGIGKSSLAIEYGKQHKQNKVVRYFNASSKAKLDQRYLELAKEFNINVEQQSANLIMQLVNIKLIATQAKLLFIFDNVDNYDDLKEYLVNLPINIKAIITTRQPMLIIDKTHLVLGEFSNEEAEQYLNSSLKARNFNKLLVRNLIENIGTLPYDIKCIAAYLLNNPSIDSKVNLYEIANKIKDKLFHEFIISTDPIKQQAWHILQYASNLDPDFISIEIIKELFPKHVELSYAAIKRLESLSLISIINNNNDQAGLRIHRKLQKKVQHLRKHYPKHSIANQKLTKNLLEVLDNLFPEVTRNPNIQWQIAGNLQPHLEKLLSTDLDIQPQSKLNLVNLYYKLANYYSIVNINYQLALKYAKTALEIGNTSYNNNACLANVFNIIGTIYRRIGNTKEGAKYSQKSLNIRQQLYSGNHPDIADSLYNLGMAYNQQGDTLNGLKYSQMALEMNKQLYKNSHYDIAYSLNAVGICYISSGHFEQSLNYLKQGLQMFTELAPINYEKIAESHSNLAYNYSKLGNYVKALEHARTSLNIIQKAYPDGHPKTIYSLNDLGDILIRSNTKNIKQGLRLLHQALELVQKFNMNKHFTAAFLFSDLGWGYFKNKDYKIALEYSEKALALRKEMYGDNNHHELAESLYNLATINLALGNKNTGLYLYKDALKMYSALSLGDLPESIEIKQKIKELDSC